MAGELRVSRSVKGIHNPPDSRFRGNDGGERAGMTGENAGMTGENAGMKLFL